MKSTAILTFGLVCMLSSAWMTDHHIFPGDLFTIMLFLIGLIFSIVGAAMKCPDDLGL